MKQIIIKELFTFEEAISFVKQGYKVTRKRWQELKEFGIDMYLICDAFDKERFSLDYDLFPDHMDKVIYKVVGSSKKMYESSQVDIFANDWAMCV